MDHADQVEPPPPNPPRAAQTFLDIAKADFLLIGAFLLLLGLISTDAYYRNFGLRFQFLTYPWNLIVFRGVLTVVRYPLLWLLVIPIVVAIQVDRWLAAAAWFRYNGWRIGIVYVLAAVVIVCMPSLGTLIGSKEAKEDRYFSKSTLPKLYKIVGTGGVQEPCDNCLLLLMDSSEIVYFSGIPDGGQDVQPRAKIRSRSTIDSIETTH
jgi:hypothetical protein